MQLGLAKDIADHVRQRYPQFQLWKDPQLLRLVLRSMSDDVNRSLFHNMRFMIVDFVCVLLEADSVEDGMQYIRKMQVRPPLRRSGCLNRLPSLTESFQDLLQESPSPPALRLTIFDSPQPSKPRGGRKRKASPVYEEETEDDDDGTMAVARPAVGPSKRFRGTAVPGPMPKSADADDALAEALACGPAAAGNGAQQRVAVKNGARKPSGNKKGKPKASAEPKAVGKPKGKPVLPKAKAEPKPSIARGGKGKGNGKGKGKGNGRGGKGRGKGRGIGGETLRPKGKGGGRGDWAAFRATAGRKFAGMPVADFSAAAAAAAPAAVAAATPGEGDDLSELEQRIVAAATAEVPADGDYNNEDPTDLVWG